MVHLMSKFKSWSGLGVAKAYLEMHPTEKMAVFEGMIESCDYPDFPMRGAYDVPPFSYIPAAVVPQCRTDFAKAFWSVRANSVQHQGRCSQT